MKTSVKLEPLPVGAIVYPEVVYTIFAANDSTKTGHIFQDIVSQQFAERKHPIRNLPSLCSQWIEQVQNQTANRSEKNEAEVADDWLMSSRPKITSSLLTIAKCFGHGPVKYRGSTTDVIDRQLRSMYQNVIEERRLLKNCFELDKQSHVNSSMLRQKKKAVFEEYKKLIKRTPDTEEWLRKRKSRTDSWQERERGEISKRYSRRSRHFRAPPELKETADRIKSIIKDDGGDLRSPNQIFKHDINDELTRWTNRNMKRRHSVPSERQTVHLPKIQESLRRMTLGHIDLTNDSYTLAPNLGSRVYLSDIMRLKKQGDEDRLSHQDGDEDRLLSHQDGDQAIHESFNDTNNCGTLDKAE